MLVFFVVFLLLLLLLLLLFFTVPTARLIDENYDTVRQVFEDCRVEQIVVC